ncbi:N-acetylmuramoyl-L-alanine amidase [Pseudodesulfovibrio indicus]|uniref:N-acetylmuramoyl-L-alanine amidase n=1 Tax=Pseudodesulfovibrio indicus TaxID=1716143 RepID=A0A140D9C4_9BACT|nr:N-acetylmuramoyl-L-alanine amidase [Pseudodesulfovibrio indicus]AMK09791.1 N-acetylmuramoyl-L-alanine amidase [Pseudodesulfovibrio indicus]TDT86247.1 N-acetylmuramoyl-L-alanine amidase [Pseudodesulfovibrio indicus]
MKQPNAAHTNILFALALCALAVLLLYPSPAPAASAQSYFTEGHAAFHALLKNSRKAKYRSNWEKVEKDFTRCLKASPNGPYAPKALYYIGRVYEELGARSGLKSDFRRAVDYYGRVLARYERHGWADDCLYRRADIYARRLNETDPARLDLASIIVEYPRSDMRAKAEAMLKRLGKYDWAIAQVSGSAQASGPAAAPAAKPVRQQPLASKASDPSGMAHLDVVRFTSSDEYTRVVLELDAQVKYRYQVLGPNTDVNRPHRLYIDIQDARLGHDVTASTTVADGILRSIRTGQYSKDTTRVVLDFLDMQDYKIFPLQNPYRIVVDVYAPDGSAPATTRASLGPRVEEPHHTTADSTYRPPSGSKQMAGSLLEQLGLTVKTIMIDAGHGGKDPGAVANGMREKDINLKFAKLLGKKFEAQGFHVLYTRTTDVFIPLEKRTAMANVQKADLFLSIHCNANRSRKINGLETYSLNLAKSDAAVRIAARENAVDPRAISDLQFILTDLMVNSKIKESRDLASDVQSNTINRIRKKYTVKNQGTREAPFYVLMGAKMPSVLVEIGYITNKTEASRLSSDSYLDHLSNGIVEGVLAYKGKIERYAMN